MPDAGDLGWPDGASGWIPIAGDGCGDYYVLLTGGEIVGYVDADPDLARSRGARLPWNRDGREST